MEEDDSVKSTFPENDNNLGGGESNSAPVNLEDDHNSLNGEVDPNIANKDGLTSSVWVHFQRYKVNDEWKAKCNGCSKVLGGDTVRGTTTLTNHIKKYCKRQKLTQSKQSTIGDCFNKHEKSTTTSSILFDQETSRCDMARMIVLHEYPLAMVDHIATRRFLAGLQPLFKCPTRNTIKKDILDIYEKEKHRVTKILDNIGSRVAITTDMWTSNQKKGYMVVTAHFVDQTWKLRSYILSFTYVPAPHTGKVLSDELLKILLEWNLDRKLSTITLDNCSTNDAMISDLLGRLEVQYLLLGGQLLHLRCGTHILNLIVKDGLDMIKSTIENIRASVLYWTATPKRHETFVLWCIKSNVSFTKKMVQDCPTRWNSTYLMLESAWLYRDVFPRLKQIDDNYTCVPSAAEWGEARVICDKLKLFYDVTLLFSGTKYPTANLFFDKVCLIKYALNEWVSSFDPVISNMASTMLLKFDKYWDNIHGILGVAAILDPRYKLVLVEYHYGKLFPNDPMQEVENVKNIVVELIKRYQNTSSTSNADVTSDGIVDMTDYDQYVQTRKRQKTSPIMTDFDLYLTEDVLPRSPDFDILLWWKMNGVKYPTLQKIAKDIFAIPISTVASESAFSSGGRLISKHRSKLKQDTIEALMCSRSWLWDLEQVVDRVVVDDYFTLDEEEAEDEDDVLNT